MPCESTRALLQHAGPTYSAAAAVRSRHEMAEAVAQPSPILDEPAEHSTPATPTPSGEARAGRG
jgi:hypothetical protein